jgi:hypothetical protein
MSTAGYGRSDGVSTRVVTVTSRPERPELSLVRCTMADVSDDQPAPDGVRVLDRLLAAGLSLQRIEQHLEAGRVRVDGRLATDRRQPAPPPARIVIC